MKYIENLIRNTAKYLRAGKKHCLSLFMRCFYQKLLLSKSEDEEKASKEFILNTLLISSIGLLLILEVFVVVRRLGNFTNHGMSIELFTLILLFVVSLYVVARKGFLKTSAVLLLSTLYLGATYGIVKWGYSMEMSLLTYVLIIFMSSILTSTRTTLAYSLLIILTMIFTCGLQVEGVIQPYWYWNVGPDITDGIQISFIYIVMIAVGWLARREIEKQLYRARKSEQLLKIERDNLEITVERRTEELRKATDSQIEHLHTIAEFGKISSGILHDIVSPLTAVSLNLAEYTPSKGLEEKDSFIEQAKRAQDRLEKYIRAAYKQLKNQSGEATFKPSDEVDDALTVLQHSLIKNNIQVKCKVDKDLEMYGDNYKFNKIVTNLVKNAIDACLEKITATNLSSIKYNYQPEIYITLERRLDDRLIVLQIKDNGCGIKDKNKKEIFRSFFTTKAHEKGTGLGLSLIKELIEKSFDGNISFQSIEGEGASFSVTIPENKSIKNVKNVAHTKPRTNLPRPPHSSHTAIDSR